MHAPADFGKSREAARPPRRSPQQSSDNLGLWLAPRGALPDGDAGAIGLHDCAHFHSGRHDSAGLRARRERHVARVPAGDGSHSARGVVHRRFAKYSASPGSLYTYAAMILPPWLARSPPGVCCLPTSRQAPASSAASIITRICCCATPWATKFPPCCLVLVVTGASIWIAWRDVKISARLMLWIEAVSLLVIVVVMALVLVRHGFIWIRSNCNCAA